MILTSLFLGMEIYKEKTRKNHYMNLIGLDIPKSSVVLKSEDSHGGFHGDGVLYEEIQLEGDDITIFVKNALNTNYWRKLPMDGDLKKLIYGEHGSNYSYGGCGEMMPKDIANGLYYFNDRYYTHEGSIFDRYSQNFNFALFDINKGKLYILKFDS
jgi:hypothetical protein